MAKKKYYAVQCGRVPGVYLTWEECKKQVDGFSGAVYKSFPVKEEALAFAEGVKREQKANALEKQTDSESVNLETAGKKALGNEEQAEATAYVDGSYYHVDGRFSCGVVMFWKGKEYHFCEAFDDPELALMRNVAGEIKGAEKAMGFCLEHGIRSLRIFHDYEGISKWCEGQWEARKEGTKAYREYYQAASRNVNISFQKVKGHSGDTYNDLADQLAKKALGLV